MTTLRVPEGLELDDLQGLLQPKPFRVSLTASMAALIIHTNAPSDASTRLEVKDFLLLAPDEPFRGK